MTINPKTTAAISDHPIHPMLIPFPVACLVGAPQHGGESRRRAA